MRKWFDCMFAGEKGKCLDIKTKKTKPQLTAKNTQKSYQIFWIHFQVKLMSQSWLQVWRIVICNVQCEVTNWYHLENNTLSDIHETTRFVFLNFFYHSTKSDKYFSRNRQVHPPIKNTGFQCERYAPSNLGSIMFHHLGTFYFYKANITHLR